MSIHEWTNIVPLFGRNIEQVIRYEIDPDGHINLVDMALWVQLAKRNELYYDERGEPKLGPAYKEQRFPLCWATSAWRLETIKKIRKELELVEQEAA